MESLLIVKSRLFLELFPRRQESFGRTLQQNCMSEEVCFLHREGGAPFLEVLQYQVDAWSGRSKPLFHLPVPKINLIYGPRVGDVSDIKLIRTDTTLDLSQKAEKRYPALCSRGRWFSSPLLSVTVQDILNYRNTPPVKTKTQFDV